jgi:hypothetical protein
VRGLFDRFFAKSPARRSRVVCHLRENGPIAYELDLFTAAPREGADAMLASALAWTWKSATREWAELTRISLPAFLEDLSSGDLLIAGTEGEPPADISDALVRTWLRRFCRTDASPLAAVVSAAGGRQLLFVQQHASEPVNALLDAWRIDKAAAERKAYARLGPASLEAIADRLRADP